MVRVRRAEDRGRSKWSWLDSRHSFSFNRYHDPEHMGFRTLRVINDDFIGGGGRFGMHPHENMEILTWVLSGSVVHEDSTGAKGETRPGEIQRMTAGTGIFHSEANGSETDGMRLLQIWIQPERPGLEPGYEQTAFSPENLQNKLRVIASRDARDGSVTIHQDAVVLAGRLDAGSTVEYPIAEGRGVWLQVAGGEVTANGERLKDGDALALEQESLLRIEAPENAEVLVFDLK
ncbi:MAG: quercetin 2,3-dioxygenase [Candidatus Solibacter sp.]|nr:quercetin 2,3-dioxygenase [Candidatus Solibacter sp.]